MAAIAEHPSTPADSATAHVASHAKHVCASGESTSDAPATTTAISSTQPLASSAPVHAAHELDHWHATGQHRNHPPGHLRNHPLEHVRIPTRGWANAMHRVMLDPDGRPRRLAHAGRF
jgi:hypothetical protein